ncbi:hypothetical protein DPMN_136807 [Dreissena polymorpha]|uniref:Uncharacterized protein n=1 Tax=Dreissena polymorpha TaxID=45954 RepID=A0A9D4G416_DREPO|nr:hypothetical protein DPMN_136807 [Dreissena polymorpha]
MLKFSEGAQTDRQTDKRTDGQFNCYMPPYQGNTNIYKCMNNAMVKQIIISLVSSFVTFVERVEKMNENKPSHLTIEELVVHPSALLLSARTDPLQGNFEPHVFRAWCREVQRRGP